MWTEKSKRRICVCETLFKDSTSATALPVVDSVELIPNPMQVDSVPDPQPRPSDSVPHPHRGPSSE